MTRQHCSLFLSPQGGCCVSFYKTFCPEFNFSQSTGGYTHTHTHRHAHTHTHTQTPTNTQTDTHTQTHTHTHIRTQTLISPPCFCTRSSSYLSLSLLSFDSAIITLEKQPWISLIYGIAPLKKHLSVLYVRKTSLSKMNSL